MKHVNVGFEWTEEGLDGGREGGKEGMLRKGDQRKWGGEVETRSSPAIASDEMT